MSRKRERERERDRERERERQTDTERQTDREREFIDNQDVTLNWRRRRVDSGRGQARHINRREDSGLDVSCLPFTLPKFLTVSYAHTVNKKINATQLSNTSNKLC